MSVLPFKGHNGGPAMEDEAEAPEQETNEDFLRFMGMSVAEILLEGQKALFADLVSKVRSGQANHQEKAILRNILRDNGLTLGIPQEDQRQLPPSDLPEFNEPEY